MSMPPSPNNLDRFERQRNEDGSYFCGDCFQDLDQSETVNILNRGLICRFCWTIHNPQRLMMYPQYSRAPISMMMRTEKT